MFAFHPKKYPDELGGNFSFEELLLKYEYDLSTYYECDNDFSFCVNDKKHLVTASKKYGKHYSRKNWQILF